MSPGTVKHAPAKNQAARTVRRGRMNGRAPGNGWQFRGRRHFEGDGGGAPG